MYKNGVDSTKGVIPPPAEDDMTNQPSPEAIACPNPACPDYDKPGPGNIIRFGKTRQGIQRFCCRACNTTFTATHSTIFYRRRTPRQGIMETLVLLAEGVPINSVARAKRIKVDTIREWLNDAARHRQAIETELRTAYRLRQEQVDHLWTHLHQDGNRQKTE